MRKKPSGKNIKIIKAAVLIATLLVVIGAVALFNLKTTPAIEFQKGMGYAGWSKDAYNSDESDISLQRVKETGANWASVLVTWAQTNCWSGDIHRTGQTPSDESVVRAIRKAHEQGMKVMFKLHLDLVDQSDGSWRGEIGCVKDSDWDIWFDKYTDYVMYYVNIANKEKVEMICVGTELSATDGAKGYMWRDLIKKVRAKYHGSLTYAAHWDRYQDIRFWDLLDYVGINAYFPLTDQMDPTYDQLKEGWKQWADEMEVFQKDIKKPIIFPEVGCNSADGSAIRPWEHVARTEVNVELQARYYKVLMDIFWEKPWFYGLYWWYWGTNENMGGKYDRGFTPQNKPAQDVVKERYAMPVIKTYGSK